jgi:hypothetical protein
MDMVHDRFEDAAYDDGASEPGVLAALEGFFYEARLFLSA